MTESSPASSRRENNSFGHPLLEYSLAVVRYGRFMIVSILAITTLAIVVSLLLPVSYRSVASILPPRESAGGGLAAASSLLRNVLPNVRLGGSSGAQTTQQYLAILKSRTVLEAVAREFDLARVYDIADSSMEMTLKELEANVEIVIQPEDHLTIAVVDREPDRAAAMANAFVRHLNATSIALSTSNARSNREFIEKRVRETEKELFRAEESLKDYLKRGGVPIGNEAGGEGLSAIAEIYALRVRKEVELGVLERSLGQEHPEVDRRRMELEEISRKSAQLPESSVEGVRLYRNVMIQQTILEFIYPLFEQGRVDEQRDVPVLMVLDHAVPAERKFKPRRMLIVGGAFLFSVLFSLLVVAFRRFLEGLRLTEADRLGEIRAAVLRLWPRRR